VAGCEGYAGPAVHEKSVESRALDAEGTFRLENVNGAVEITTWKQPQVRIEAEKTGSPGFVEEVTVAIEGEGDEVSVETRHPKGWSSGFFGGGGQVTYRVTVPERARLEVRTTNGRVRVLESSGPVSASTTNGSLEVDRAAGTVEATTVNGSVQVGFRSTPSSGLSRIATTNGSVTLSLPADATGRVEADTVNGGIETEFPLEVSGALGGRRLSGKLGDGQARYELHTVNGKVRIRRGSIES
jgi:hypothetical protein